MVHDSPYKSSVKWQRCTLGNSSCCDQTELQSSATSTSLGLVWWNYMKLHYMKYGKYGSGQFLRKFRLSSEPSPERCRTLPSESSSFATRNCRNCGRFQCFWCRCALRIQGSSGFSARKSHRRQNAAPVPTNTRRRSNSPPCQKKGPNSNLIQFDLCFNCYRPFHTPIAPYTNGTAPTSCNPMAWPIHTYKSRWTLPFEFYNVLSPLLSILLFHFFLFHRQLLKDMVKTRALVHVAIGKTSAFPPDSHLFRSFAGHIEPLPQRPIFQVLLFFL